MCIHTKPSGKKFKAEVEVLKSPEGDKIAVIIPAKQTGLLRSLLVENVVFSDGEQGSLAQAIYEELASPKEHPAGAKPEPQEIKVGSKVKVVRKVEKEDGWKDVWTSSMDSYVGNGEVYEVLRVDSAGVRFDRWNFPKSALEVVG